MTSLVEAGSRVGRYLLVRRLGIGGFAEVWEAEDQELRRKVAIKLALPALCEEPEFIERFLREARRAANLDHPNILAVYDFGMHEGRPFLVMPVVPGGSLASRMTPPPPVKDALRWLGELAAALDHAHEEGVIHRDVKPPNALFDRKGRLLLSDFGIAKSLEESTVLTQTGAAIGTPAFMAPEQALAQPDRFPIGPAADQYALGILAYRMLTGRFPFEGPTFALLRKTIEEPPPPPSTYRPELSAEVDAVFTRVLAKVAGDRYGSCEAFVTSLANVLAADAAPPRESTGGDGTFVTPSATTGAGLPQRPTPRPLGPDPGTDLVSPRPGAAGPEPMGRATGAEVWTAAPDAGTGPVTGRERVGPVLAEPIERTPLVTPVRVLRPPEPERAATPPPASPRTEPSATPATPRPRPVVVRPRPVVPVPRPPEPPAPPARVPPQAHLAGSRSTDSTAAASRKSRMAMLSVVVGVASGLAIVGVLLGVGVSRFRASTPKVAVDTGVSWVPIPSGSFTMGCTQGDPECADDEKPAHTVRITRPYQMAATLTTNAQYRKCVEVGDCTPPQYRSEFDDKAKGDHPVVAVDWNQARTFCTWVGGRLPTEAEWEYAARGGKDGQCYPGGHEISHDDANFEGRRGRDVWTATSPVRSFSPNGFGLFDMAGNAFEWCYDWYDEGYYVTSPSEDPKGPSSGGARVLRGGSWGFLRGYLRVSYRRNEEPGRWSVYDGFRCTRDARKP